MPLELLLKLGFLAGKLAAVYIENTIYFFKDLYYYIYLVLIPYSTYKLVDWGIGGLGDSGIGGLVIWLFWDCVIK